MTFQNSFPGCYVQQFPDEQKACGSTDIDIAGATTIVKIWSIETKTLIQLSMINDLMTNPTDHTKLLLSVLTVPSFQVPTATCWLTEAPRSKRRFSPVPCQSDGIDAPWHSSEIRFLLQIQDWSLCHLSCWIQFKSMYLFSLFGLEEHAIRSQKQSRLMLQTYSSIE